MSRPSSMPMPEVEVLAVQRRRSYSAEEKQRMVHAPGMTMPSFPSIRTTSALIVVADRMISIGSITSLRNRNSRDCSSCNSPKRSLPKATFTPACLQMSRDSKPPLRTRSFFASFSESIPNGAACSLHDDIRDHVGDKIGLPVSEEPGCWRVDQVAMFDCSHSLAHSHGDRFRGVCVHKDVSITCAVAEWIGRSDTALK